MPSNSSSANKSLLIGIAKGLGDLLDDVVFVGGATTFILTEGRGNVRQTEDVDVIVDITSRLVYEDFSKKLRVKGFREDIHSGVMCRWKYEDHLGLKYTIDIMPVSERILGFTNKWYTEAINHSITHNVDGYNVKVVDIPHFLATKIEAFKGRGKNDFLASKDIEDIIFVIEHTPDMLLKLFDIKNEQLALYIVEQFQGFLASGGFMESFGYHLDDPEKSGHILNVLKFRLPVN